jgi:FixJ family two-component response regulator
MPTARTRVRVVLEAIPGGNSPDSLNTIEDTILGSRLVIPQRVENLELRQHCESLTPREREVFVLVARPLFDKLDASKALALYKTLVR